MRFVDSNGLKLEMSTYLVGQHLKAGDEAKERKGSLCFYPLTRLPCGEL